MEKIVKAVIVMTIITVIAAIAIVGIVYANANSSYNNVDYNEVVLAADELETQPPSWKTPEELGIIEIKEQQGWVQVLVPKEKADQLQEEQPVFKHNDKFYQISGLWVTPGLPESVVTPAIAGIVGVTGVGWVYVGALFLRERRKTG